MDLRRLQYFVVLANSQSLRDAADLLGISQPALSKAMKLLEEELEVPLWVRDGRKNILTDQGKALFKKGPSLIDEISDLKKSLQIGEKEKPLRIGTFEVFSTYFLKFLEILPWDEKPIEMHELLPGEIEKYLAQGDIDLGISYMPIPHPDLDFLKVTKIEMGVYTHKSAFKNLEQPHLPFVVPVPPLQGVPTRIKGLDGWPENSYKRVIKYQVTLMESALELCRQGRAAGFFPVFITKEYNNRVKNQNQLVRRYFPKSHSNCYSDVYIIKRKSSQEDQVIKQIAKAIRLICN